jgi:hypothetical protein
MNNDNESRYKKIIQIVKAFFFTVNRHLLDKNSIQKGKILN